ncbi:MAG: GGDEF domain-containing protein [Candidatus Accumulibacter sp.]|jgi:diguanylate cyclase (GGDEF)-like protein|nr:GGDEF domain-containing protein [Accumulibacter sp.]
MAAFAGRGREQRRPRNLLNRTIAAVAALFALVLVAAMVLNQRNNAKLEDILEDSVRAELLATCFGASEAVYEHVNLFQAINAEEDIDRHREEFDVTIARLRQLRDSINANGAANVKYIYVLKKIEDKYYFIFDTDDEAIAGHDDGDPATEGIVTEYGDIATVHLDAFAGKASAGIMNARDEWGSYNTGAVPLLDPENASRVIGIVGVDIDDTYIKRSKQTASSNAILLALVMAVSMGVLLVVLIFMIRRNTAMQEDLYYIANHDAVTGLYNRYFLFAHLKEKSAAFSESSPPFAIFFVDLDNFKRVNDGAGHDAGDDLLRAISEFLCEFQNEHAAPGDDDDVIGPITARIGGDEFLLITPGAPAKEAAAALARAMLDGFQSRENLKPTIRDYGIGLSIGIALFPSMSRDYNELMKLADIAMYHAKHHGKNNYALYHPEMGEGIDGRALSIR